MMFILSCTWDIWEGATRSSGAGEGTEVAAGAKAGAEAGAEAGPEAEAGVEAGA